MLRFIKGSLTTIDGIEIYPIISLVVFVAFFVGLFWWVFTADKKYLEEMENHPLNDDK